MRVLYGGGVAGILLALVLFAAVAPLSCRNDTAVPPRVFTVTYAAGYGPGPHAPVPDAVAVEEGTRLTEEQLPELSADGWEFQGWHTGVTRARPGYEVKGDVTLTATWQPAEDTGGGSGGGTEGGGSTDGESTGGGETDGGETGDGEVVVPEPREFTVTYETERGSLPAGFVNPQRVEEGTRLTTEKYLPALTADGWTFIGWYIGGTSAEGHEATGDVTLTAKWTKKYIPVADLATYLSSLSGEGPHTVAIEGELDDDSLNNLISALRNNTSVKVNLDLSDAELARLDFVNNEENRKGAFRNCTGLVSVTLPDSMTYIGPGSFSGCTGLTSIGIPDGVTFLGEAAFQNLSNLESVSIPSSVTSIGSNAFSGCTNLTTVNVSGVNAWTVTYNSVFDGIEATVTKLTTAYVNYNWTRGI